MVVQKCEISNNQQRITTINKIKFILNINGNWVQRQRVIYDNTDFEIALIQLNNSISKHVDITTEQSRNGVKKEFLPYNMLTANTKTQDTVYLPAKDHYQPLILL